MITYQDTLDGITPDALTGFFVGWPSHPSPETHLRMLKGSFATAIALDGDQVVGFANAVSDGVLASYIPLLEVLPNYQGHGVGKNLIERLLGQLDDLYMVDIVCDAELEAFYRPLGFVALTGMAKRNYANQTGTPG